MSKILAGGVFAAALATATVQAAPVKTTAVIGRGGTQPFVLKVLQRAGGASASPRSSLPSPNVQSGTEDRTVPLKPGQEKIPALTFSYFDPDARQYVTRLTTPIGVDVASGSGPSSVTALTTSSPSQTAAANPAATDLAPNKVEPGSFVSSLRPVLFAPWFIALQGLPAMALVIMLVGHRRRQRHAHDRNHASERAAEAAIREQLAAMDAALAANCAPAFFRAARHAVQERLAQRWKLPVSQVTVTEINRRLNGNGDDLRALFAFADGVVYSGQRVLPEDLKRWRDTVIQHLRKLEDL
jgi:hypothetical protein